MTEQFYIFCDNKLVEVTMSLSRATDVAAQLRKVFGGAFKDKVKVKSYLVDVHQVQSASDRVDGLADCLDYVDLGKTAVVKDIAKSRGIECLAVSL